MTLLVTNSNLAPVFTTLQKSNQNVKVNQQATQKSFLAQNKSQANLNSTAKAILAAKPAKSAAAKKPATSWDKYIAQLKTAARQIAEKLLGKNNKKLPQVVKCINSLLDNAKNISKNPQEFIKWFVANWDKICKQCK